MADSEHGWRIGDRVSLCPDGRPSRRVEGTVEGVDEEGKRGVRIRFDHLFNGVDNCLASHDELTLIERGT